MVKNCNLVLEVTTLSNTQPCHVTRIKSIFMTKWLCIYILHLRFIFKISQQETYKQPPLIQPPNASSSRTASSLFFEHASWNYTHELHYTRTTTLYVSYRRARNLFWIHLWSIQEPLFSSTGSIFPVWTIQCSATTDFLFSNLLPKVSDD